jgi:phosphatidylserine/phosphatidylglycerophosphate/cardiolipin synthase-like enzyme
MKNLLHVVPQLLLGLLFSVTAIAQSVVSWDFGTSSANANPSSGVPISHLLISEISQGNNNGTTTLLTTTSASSGYTGSSGTYNAGAAARTGALVTGTNGSAYFQFTLTPDAASTVTLSAISFGTRSTSTGPQAYSLRSSADSYASDVATGSISNNSTWVLKSNTGLTITSAMGSALTFRIYGYNGAGSPASGTANWRIDDLTLTLSVTFHGQAGSGIGTASVSPYRWKFDESTTLQFVVKPSSDTVNGVRIIKPSVVNWNAASVTVSPDTAMTAVIGDTLQITNVELTGKDSLVAVFSGVTAIDSTDIFSIKVQTHKGDSPFGQILSLPQIFVYGSPRPMAQVKRKEANGDHSLLGKWAVVKGVVTVANEFGGPSYVQDNTAAIALFDSSVSNHIERGDEVVLLGMVAPFNDLFELTPCILLEKISEGNTVDTLVRTAAQILGQGVAEPDEGRLIRINGITSVATTGGSPTTTWSTTGSGTNYKITDATGTTEIRISSRTNIANTPTPSGTFDVVGVLGQFLSNYQILPRSVDDIVPEGNGPRFTSAAPYEKNITSTSITVEWTTDVAGSSKVKYGKTTSYGSEVSDPSLVTKHSVTLPGLEPATIYNIQLESANDLGTTTSANYIVSTASATSSGTINVYFNKSVKASLARGEDAVVAKFDTILIKRIAAAAYSIDAALYSLSGTVGANIATALVAAKNRGVKVRVIGEKDNQSTAPWATLKNNGITVVDDGFDALNAGAGLMHNKFIVIDNRDGSSDLDDWVWTGSWNLTDPGTNNDAQNVIEIQDKALANAYTREFEEMWGSSTETPNASASRFGARKFDNTPHVFNIKGTPVELYFSPSDRTNGQIINTLSKAKYSISFAMLTLTRSDIANTLSSKNQTGVKVRGVLDNKSDQGSQFDTLKARGIDIFLKANVTGLLHHKYGVVDPEAQDSLQYLITGSHNWSSAAENSNNENTLIIRSKRLANLYIQEFGQRYADAGGTDPILFVKEINSDIPRTFSLQQNYPNPFNPTTTIQFHLAEQSLARLTIYDVLGRELTTLVHEQMPPGTYTVQWNASTFASGVYFYRLESGSFVQTKKLILQK